MTNPNCDGGGPCSAGQVRVLPLGVIPDHGNLILCRSCFAFEMNYRRERNRKLARDCQFQIPAWEQLAAYEGSGVSV